MTFGREPSNPPHDMNQADAKVKPVYFIHRRSMAIVMGFKRTSEIITVSGSYENDTDGFTVDQVDLQLNPLDQEVFVVVGVLADWTGPAPEPLGSIPAGALFNLTQLVAFTTTRPSAQLGLASPNCFATARRQCIAQIVSGPDVSTYTLVEQNNTELPDAEIPYLAIIATSDFFVSGTDDVSNLSNMAIEYKIYGYRAKADAATYAALVQSEVLSS